MAATFGAGASPFGTLAGWDHQNTTDGATTERATYSSKSNNELGSTLYNKRREIVSTFKASANMAKSAPAIPPQIGELNDIALTSIVITLTNDDFAGLTLTGHTHTDGSTDGTLRKAAHSISIGRGFGCFPSITPSGIDALNSCTITIECDHAEESDGSGNVKQGENHNPRITIEWTGAGSQGSASIGGYDITSDSENPTNDGYKEVTVSAIKALAFPE